MKKFFLFGSVTLLTTFLAWNCSTKLDILDNYKETTVVYALLDQTQAQQYIRIEKAFLGADNALTMAQNYDTITYLSQLSVKVEEIHNGLIYRTFSTTAAPSSPDLIYPVSVPKDNGIFAGPNQVVYAFDTPTGALNSAHEYKLTVTHVNADGVENTVTATTSLVESSSGSTFTIVNPSTALTSVSMEPTTFVTEFDYKWNPAPSARVYQPTLRFYYTEYYVNGDSAQKSTNEWNLQAQTTTDLSSTTQLDIKFGKLDFYRWVATQIQPDANVVKRRSRYVEFVVYAANQDLKDYMEINGASSSLAQDHPIYTNISGGYGIFAGRTKSLNPATGNTLIFPLGNTSIDGNPGNNNFKGLANGPYTCQLGFEKTDGTVPGCQ